MENLDGSEVQVTTFWKLENFLDLDLVVISEDIHPEFSITGTNRPSNIPYPTFRNQLTIVNFTQRLQNVTLYCGHSQSVDAHWDLQVYCESGLRLSPLYETIP